VERLPPELVALMSGVELRGTDWWDRASQQIVLSALALAGGPTQRSDVMGTIETDFGLAPTEAEVADAIAALERSGSVVELPSGHLKVTEIALERVQQSTQHLEDAETEAAAVFVAYVERLVPELPAGAVWSDVNERLLVPLVHQLGVRTYEFIQGKPFELEVATLLDAFLADYDAKFQGQLRNAVSAFLSPKDERVRAYVLARLTAYFFLAAIKITESALEQLTKYTSTKPEFVLFLDTNLLFSVLGIHDNPANESAQALMYLIRELERDSVDLRLYITPDTVAEAKAALANALGYARGIVLTRNLAEGVSKVRFSGLVQRFVDQAREPDGVRNADSYFDFYISRLLTVARDRGIELFNEDLSPLHTHQRVIDDVHSAMEFRNRRRRERGLDPKPYGQYEHDVVLWHFVRKKRDKFVETPLAARYWVVTVDYGFLGFDAARSKGGEKSIPVCVHPTALIQMLQFWVPRSSVLDGALMSTLRLPFMFIPFDPDLEATTVKLLRALSRMENVDRLSASTVAELILNDHLQTQLRSVDDTEQEIAYVRDAFVELEAQLKAELEEKTSRVADLEAVSELSEKKADDLAAEVRRLSSDVVKLTADLEAAHETQQQLAIASEAERNRHERVRFVWSRVVPVGAAGLAAAGIGWFAAHRLIPGVEVFSAIVLFTAVGGLTCWVVELAAQTRDADALEAFAVGARRFKKWLLFGLFAAIAIGVIANAVSGELLG
jgi:hypothetical protein